MLAKHRPPFLTLSSHFTMYQSGLNGSIKMIKKALGIDISKDKFDVCLLQDNTDNSGVTATFPNQKEGFNKLLKWLKKQRGKEVHACIESTGRYGDALVEFLYDKGVVISVVNPFRIKSYASSLLKRNKTDKEDAYVIAHFCLTQSLDSWVPPPQEIKELQALTRYLLTLKEDRTRVINRLKSGLRSALVIDSLNAQKLFLDKQIEHITQQIDDHIESHPDLRRQRDLLQSIDGIGSVTAAQFMAEIPDVTQFNNAGQLTAYAGMSPRITQSGSSLNRKGAINKTGNKRFRTLFYMPALSAIRYNPIVTALAQRLRDKGKHGKVIVVACMRKLLHLAYGVLKTGRPFDPNFANSQEIA